MGIQNSLREKVTLIPETMIHRNRHEIPDDFHRFPFYFVIMIPNFTGTISKAIRRNDTSFCVFFVLVYVSLLVVRLCISVPKSEKLIQQFWLKLEILFLYTVITFGFAYQFAEFNPRQTTVVMYFVVGICSLFLFSVFVIVDLLKIWKNWRHGGEDETPLPENQMIDAGDLNYYSVSICDKV